jgi:hypothetical protein
MEYVMIKNGNGVPVPVCMECARGGHKTVFGKSHFFPNNEGRNDCKETFVVNGEIRQCCCGMGDEKLEL